MKSPRIPPMVTTIIQGALLAFDGCVFDTRDSCPSCGGTLSGYDSRKKHFATIRDENGEHTITVTVKRFTCTSCGALCNADEPFYPGTRVGSPVIDLCTAFSQSGDYGRAARNLGAMGISMDRMRCRHYATTAVRQTPSLPIFGFSIPQTIFSLSSLASMTGEDHFKESDALQACGSPSACKPNPEILSVPPDNTLLEKEPESRQVSFDLPGENEPVPGSGNDEGVSSVSWELFTPICAGIIIDFLTAVPIDVVGALL